MYHKAKQIDTRVYRVRELASGHHPQVKLWKIDGQNQPSDLLTKALPKEAFTRHRCAITMIARAASSRSVIASLEA